MAFTRMFKSLQGRMAGHITEAEATAFIRKSLNKPVVLTGMMGSGKTRLGRKLAEALGVDFFDTDSLVEERAGYSVADIFRKDGEDKFREVEKRVILDTLKKGVCIVASGGGAVVSDGVMEDLKRQSVSIWLKTDIALLVKRLEKNDDRPLLKNGDPEEILRQLLEKRQRFYEQADITVETCEETGRSIAAVTKALYEFLKPCNV